MKLLVLSDIHGSAAAARIIDSIVKEKYPDNILLLGDVLYHGPRNALPGGYSPQEVVRTLTRLSPKIMAVKGNCDSEVDAMVLPFPLAQEAAWMMVDGLRIYATHGHIYSPDHLPHLHEGDAFFSGHTHIPTASVNMDGIYLCNPGSLALPKGGHPPTYGWLEDNTFHVFTADDEEYLRIQCV